MSAAPPYWREREELLAAVRGLVERGLTVGTAGNVSLRVAEDRFLITPSGREYDLLRAEEMGLCASDGSVLEGGLSPSSELPFHRAVLAARPDVGCVMHTHSTYATVVACARETIPPIVDELIYFTGGPVRTAPYGESGTAELADRLVESLGETQAVLIANHGVLGVGRTWREALTVCEIVEQVAMIWILGRAFGKVVPLPSEVVARQVADFRRRWRLPEVSL